MIQDLALFAVGVVAAFIGTVVGGGGIISLSFLLSLGLPAHVAIATNRAGALGNGWGALFKFIRSKKVEWRYALVFSVLSIVATLVGTHILIVIDKGLLSGVVGYLLLLVVIPYILSPKLGVKRKEASWGAKALGGFLYFLTLIFSSFFGAGAGIIVTYIMTRLFGLTFVESKGATIVPYNILSLGSFLIYLIHGYVNVRYAIPLFIGMLVGSYIGAHTMIKKGNEWIRVVFILISLSLAVKVILRV